MSGEVLRKIAVWFDVRGPWCYPAGSQIGRLADLSGAHVRWRPSAWGGRRFRGASGVAAGPSGRPGALSGRASLANNPA